MILRDYQITAIEGVRNAFRRHCRVCYVAPTGSGKTVQFAYMAAAAKHNTLILVHRRELVTQTSAALTTPHGIIAAEWPMDLSHRVQVASVQTLTRRSLDWSPRFIIIDEAHHAAANTWQKVLDAYPEAKVLGVTATPCRMNRIGVGLGDIFDTLVQGPTYAELVSAGWIVQPRVFAPSAPNTDALRAIAGDYRRRDIETTMDRPTITGCAIEYYKKMADGKPAIAFCASVNHAENVAQQFRNAGYRSQRVDGGTPTETRDALITGLATGAMDVLTSCDLISEGVDVPVVECGILLRPTRSLALYRQQVGRILRSAPGKTEAIILDHAGNCYRHGLPHEDIDWNLDKGTPPRPKVAPVRQCAVCFYTHAPKPTCPNCGYEYPIKEREIEKVDGKLEEVKRIKRRQEGRAQTANDLWKIAQERGYKAGWVYHRLKARHGETTARRMMKDE